MDAERPVQPALHDLVATVHAPTAVLSAADGQIRGLGAQGLFRSDRRALSRAELRVAGHEPEAVAHALTGPHGARFVGLLGTARLPLVREYIARRVASLAE